ncbi:MAG: glycosyltransferase family 2 protein [Planctomycetes bacterium]|nr:glycosyltransferase family 2 protein [Planctomycetales bacterium]MCB9893961.1 glycosyltransferase family 2 protein [Planctomycetota bacterium]
MPETAASTEPPTASGADSGVGLSIVIPAFNEAARLPAFLDSVADWCSRQRPGSEIIVVDDGSSDDTARLAARAGVRVISHLKNAGKGAAVRTGMLAANGRARLFADADGATGMDELTALEKAIAEGADIAVASREGADKLVQASPLRRFLGRWFNRTVRMGAVKGIRDTQCGFKLFGTQRAIELFNIAQEDGFAFDVELLLIAQRRGLKVAEVFVNWTEMPGSKVSLFRDGWRMLKAVRRIKKRYRRGDYDSASVRVTPSSEFARR